MQRTRLLAAATVAGLVLGAGCQLRTEDAQPAGRTGISTDVTEPAVRAGPRDAAVSTRAGGAGGEPVGEELPDQARGVPAGAALFLAPRTATHLTVTDFDAVRERLGVPEMTSGTLMTDRVEFWDRAAGSTVLLTDGLLREDNSLFMLEYGFTQDDVDWEARWAGDAPGLALALRPDLARAGVQRALADRVEVLAGAELAAAEPVVLKGAAEQESAALAADPVLAGLADVHAESLFLRPGCIPLPDALGAGASVAHRDQVTGAHDIPGLLPVQGVAVAFTGMTATFRLSYPEEVTEQQATADLAARADLAADWPLVESITFADGFAVAPEPRVGFTDGVGELEYPVRLPAAAATLTLSELLPVGVCSEVPPMAEPTGR